MMMMMMIRFLCLRKIGNICVSRAGIDGDVLVNLEGQNSNSVMW